MKILTINPGSTSFKYSLFENQKKITTHEFKKKTHEYFFDKTKITQKEFEQNLTYLIKFFTQKKYIKNIQEIKKYGLRIVHGGNYFKKPTLLNKQNLQKLKEISSLAPLHNPPALKIIKDIQDLNPEVKIYGVFDTSFHQTIPNYANTYAISKELTKKYHLKKYGFHGIACQSILSTLNQKKSNLQKKIIICHLGGGCSMTAIKNSQSIDNSMGFTPMEGLIMMTRSGDLDNGLFEYLENKLNISSSDLIKILNKKSGIYGLTGEKNMKNIIEESQKGNQDYKLAVEMFIYRIIKYIFGYYGILQGLDILVFSGGIGKGSSFIRNQICKHLEIIGVIINQKKNLENKINEISNTQSKVKIFSFFVEEDFEIMTNILKL